METVLGHLREIIPAVSIQPVILTVWNYGSGGPKTVSGRADWNRAIGRSLRSVRSGEGRRAVAVLRDLNPGVSGFRRDGHGADELEIRQDD